MNGLVIQVLAYQFCQRKWLLYWDYTSLGCIL